MQTAPDTVVMIEDSPTEARLALSYLEGENCRIVHAASGAAGLRCLARERPAAVLLDLGLPDIGGLEVLERLGDCKPMPLVIVITAEAGIDTVIAAMRLGAFDYLVKPYGAERLRITLRNALDHHRLSNLVQSYRAPYEGGFFGMVGNSPAIQAVYRTVEAAAVSSATVFITGQSGTGKELCARAIHLASPRRQGPFVTLNCAAISKDIMEAEIFGHVKGAFTGAGRNRKGAAEAAEGGTLFLDEVCETDLVLQAKLLRFVHSGHFRRVGESTERRADIRFVCATNRDPAEMVARGLFREDLYYRLHVIPIEMPALTRRGDDVLMLARHFLRTFSAEEGKKFQDFTPEAEAAIAAYAWPGNVRELQNALRKAVVLNAGATMTAEMIDLGPEAPPEAPRANAPAEAHCRLAPVGDKGGSVRPLREVERMAIEDALALCQGNVTLAARLLDVNPSTIYRKQKAWHAG
ncbi:MAG: sigma-54 dependent transcriptional regulator [Alphaproteobacteria bacterium]|nr:sigma-54 dependent transcriptional regulator [Alphaproteobacteria bacterium]